MAVAQDEADAACAEAAAAMATAACLPMEGCRDRARSDAADILVLEPSYGAICEPLRRPTTAPAKMTRGQAWISEGTIVDFLDTLTRSSETFDILVEWSPRTPRSHGRPAALGDEIGSPSAAASDLAATWSPGTSLQRASGSRRASLKRIEVQVFATASAVGALGAAGLPVSSLPGSRPSFLEPAIPRPLLFHPDALPRGPLGPLGPLDAGSAKRAAQRRSLQVPDDEDSWLCGRDAWRRRPEWFDKSLLPRLGAKGFAEGKLKVTLLTAEDRHENLRKGLTVRPAADRGAPAELPPLHRPAPTPGAGLEPVSGGYRMRRALSDCDLSRAGADGAAAPNLLQGAAQCRSVSSLVPAVA